MMAILTPFRWLVRAAMRSVVLCRSNSVRPQDGHETNSVFVMRTPAALKDAEKQAQMVLVGARRGQADAVAQAVAQERSEDGRRAEQDFELITVDGHLEMHGAVA